MILLQTAEVYVVNERNNKKIKLKVLFVIQDLRKVICHNVPRSSLIYNTSFRHEGHECNTNDTNVTRVRH